MTLRWVEGFEVANQQAILDRRYGTLPIVAVDPGRRSGFGLRHADDLGGGTLTLTPPIFPAAADRAWLVGLAVRFVEAATAPMITWRTSSNEQCALWFVRDGADVGHLEFRRLTETIAASVQLPAEVWYFLEAKVYCDDAAGRIEIRIDQTPIIELSAIDTRGFAGSPAIDRVDVSFLPAAGGAWEVDDLYLASDPSFDALEFLGDFSTVALFPAADGAVVNWTPSAAGPHADLVDDDLPDDDMTFVSAIAGSNLTDVYAFDPLGEDHRGRILGMQHATHRRRDDAAATTLRHVTEDPRDALTVEGPIDAVATGTYAERSTVTEANAQGRAIERQDIDAQRYGMRAV